MTAEARGTATGNGNGDSGGGGGGGGGGGNGDNGRCRQRRQLRRWPMSAIEMVAMIGWLLKLPHQNSSKIQVWYLTHGLLDKLEFSKMEK